MRQINPFDKKNKFAKMHILFYIESCRKFKEVPLTGWDENTIPEQRDICNSIIKKAIEFVGLEVGSELEKELLPTEIHEFCHLLLNQVVEVNISSQSYSNAARKQIWHHFIKTGVVLRAIIDKRGYNIHTSYFKDDVFVFQTKNGFSCSC